MTRKPHNSSDKTTHSATGYPKNHGNTYKGSFTPQEAPPPKDIKSLFYDPDNSLKRKVSPSQRIRKIPGEALPPDNIEDDLPHTSDNQPHTAEDTETKKASYKANNEEFKKTVANRTPQIDGYYLIDPKTNCVSALSEERAKKLIELDRSPFREILTNVLQCGPSATELMKFSALHPDRWARCIELFATLGGFAEKREVDIHHSFEEIETMSDLELDKKIKEFEDEQKERGLLKTLDLDID